MAEDERDFLVMWCAMLGGYSEEYYMRLADETLLKEYKHLVPDEQALIEEGF